MDHGGSGKVTTDLTIQELGLVKDTGATPIPNYPIPIGSSGYVDGNLIPPLARQMKDGKKVPTLVGPDTVIPGVPAYFIITNFDSFTKYELSCVGGRVDRMNDQVTFVPTAITKDENTCIVINEMKFPLSKKNIKVLVPRVLKAIPDIISQPTISLNYVKNLTLNSEWLFTDNLITDWDILKQTNTRTPPTASDTLTSIDWLVSTSTNPYDSTKVLKSLRTVNYTVVVTTEFMVPNELYYIFLRHNASVFGPTEWSIPLPVRTIL
jgi:hypothetical protein